MDNRQQIEKYGKNIYDMTQYAKSLQAQLCEYEAGSVERYQIRQEIEQTVQDIKDYKIFMARYFAEINRREK